MVRWVFDYFWEGTRALPRSWCLSITTTDIQHFHNIFSHFGGILRFYGVLPGLERQLVFDHNDTNSLNCSEFHSREQLICGEDRKLNGSIKSSVDGKPNVFDA